MTPPRPLPVCNALWIGRSLGRLERTSLSSFVEAGHRVDLYAYDDLAGVPAGVTVRVAEEVMPRARLLRHRATGSWSLGSNRFRYELLRAGRGVWIDCDLLCLRPLPDEPFLVGFENERRLNGAVLRLPRAHPILDDLLAIFDTPRWIPPWAGVARRLRYRLRHRLEPGFGVEDMPWGSAGPLALTHHVRRHGLLDRVRPVEDFYPVSLRDAGALLARDPSVVAASIRATTCCLHLWGQALRRQAAPPPPTSFLAAVLEGRWRHLLPRTLPTGLAAT